MTIPTTCQHWYDFPAPSGPTITGVCRKCGAVQTVPTMGSIRGEGRVKSKYRAMETPPIVSRAEQEDYVDRKRRAREQANSAIAW